MRNSNLSYDWVRVIENPVTLRLIASDAEYLIRLAVARNFNTPLKPLHYL